MRHNLFITLLLLSASMVSANDVTQNVGLQVGFDRHLYRLNAPSEVKDDKTELSKQPLNGGKLGFVYDVTFYKGLGMYLGFNYSYTMHSSPWTVTNYNEQGRYTKYAGIQYRYKAEEHILDWNVLLQYKFEIAGDTYLGFYTGPSIQYIAQYKSRDYFRNSDGTPIIPEHTIFEYSVNTEDIVPYYKRYNVTFGLGAILQYDGYFIRGGYDFGLINPYRITTFGEVTVENEKGVPYPIFTETSSNDPDSRLTRGRHDSWFITLGVFIWQSDK